MKRGREEESESREENLYLEKSEADLEVMRKGIRRLIRVEEMEKEEAVGREKVGGHSKEGKERGGGSRECEEAEAEEGSGIAIGEVTEVRADLRGGGG